MCSAGPLKRLAELDPRDEITTGANRPTEQMRQLKLNASDVPMGSGMLDAARSTIINRRDRLRIGE